MVLLCLLIGCDRQAIETDTGIPADTDTDPAAQPIWKQLNIQPCALAEDGQVRCWRSEAWDEIGVFEYGAPPIEPLETFNPGYGIFWGISKSTGLPVMLFQPQSSRPNNVTGYTQIHATCALLEGELDCWTREGLEDFQAERYTLLSGPGWYVMLTESNELRMLSVGGPPAWDRIPLDGPVQELMAIYPSVGCALFETGEIECYGPGAPQFDNPPYVDIAGGYMFGCGVKPEGVVECNNGESYDFGEPLRDLTVWSWQTYQRVYEGTPNEGWGPVIPSMEDEPHICVITESNAIRCQGWRYDFPDLQAALPKGR